MPVKNIVFAIAAPFILGLIIAAIVVGIGETLLHMHELGHEIYHVGAWPSPEENEYWQEIANLYPVTTALVIAMLVLIGGGVASALAPHRPRQMDAHHEAGSHH